ncbi:MAG: formylglycine-generating enzyme family protein [Candidatus Krumholzibacteriia bacterium]
MLVARRIPPRGGHARRSRLGDTPAGAVGGEPSLVGSSGRSVSHDLVPPESFQMGSPDHGPGVNSTRCSIRSRSRGDSGSATEVTQAVYESVTGGNPSRWAAPEHPVENVTWFDCLRFCNLLSEQHGLQPAYVISEHAVDWDLDADGYRLPTEAEWEYASRAGTGSRFSFGDDPAQLHRYANFCDRSCPRAWRDSTQNDGQAFTAPVGCFEPNPWGLHDMHGNVWEWCWDWWAPFAGEAQVDPLGPAVGDHRVEKGGCWEAGAGMCRNAYRHYVEPDQKRSYLGFRVVRTQP